MDPNSSPATTQEDDQSSIIAQDESPKFALDLNYPVIDAKSGYKIVNGVINIDSDDDEDDIDDAEDAGADDLVDNADNSVADDVDHSHTDKDDANGHADEQNNESYNN